MTNLYSYSLLTIFLAGLVIIVGACEIGWQLGIRSKSKGGQNVTTLESAIIGILALMIGFTFAMALTRFEARRDAVLNEANAIGTTALRARLLAEPYRTDSLKLLKEYVQIRLDIAQSDRSLAETASAIERSNAIQETLWLQAKAVAASDTGMVPTGLYVQTLNDMIDSQAKRLSGLRNRVPNLVFLMLFAIAAVAAGFGGYASGIEPTHSRVPIYLMGSLVCVIIMLILDLDRPASGFIVNNQQAMIDAAEAIAAFPELK
jgi:hypothetical protein